MSFGVIFKEPAILIVISFFIVFLLTLIKNYMRVKVSLVAIKNYLQSFEKKELSYRFNQLDEFMLSRSYTEAIWENFKKALVFPEKLFVSSGNINTSEEGYRPDIYLTVDASCFFNEESLITSKINHKFIQIMPTILTGLGPFFTFLKLAIAFTAIDFSSQDSITSIALLMENIQIAALCSVFAVGFSLIFMFIEKILYNKVCRKHCIEIQKELIRIFDVVTSEQFLIDLIKESKILNLNNDKLLKSLPDSFANALGQTISEATVPYLENILYGINKLNENISKKSGNDVIDKLF